MTTILDDTESGNFSNCPAAVEAASKVPHEQLADAMIWTEAYLRTLKDRSSLFSQTHTKNLLAITRLCACAQDGAHPAASQGERVANKLFKALDAIGDDLALLDPELITAFQHLFRLAAGPWDNDHDKTTVFQMIRKAASPTS